MECPRYLGVRSERTAGRADVSVPLLWVVGPICLSALHTSCYGKMKQRQISSFKYEVIGYF